MKPPSFLAARLVLTVLLMCPTVTSAQEFKAIQLLEPQIHSGRPLMQVLKDRRSSRSFSTDQLPMQVLSNMLWAAFGVNRPDSGKRTAPSARNWQEIDIYAGTHVEAGFGRRHPGCDWASAGRAGGACEPCLCGRFLRNG